MRLSRRDFLKKSVAGAIGVAAAGVVGIPAMAEEEKEALYIRVRIPRRPKAMRAT